jgi:hypothetical protein
LALRLSRPSSQLPFLQQSIRHWSGSSHSRFSSKNRWHPTSPASTAQSNYYSTNRRCMFRSDKWHRSRTRRPPKPSIYLHDMVPHHHRSHHPHRMLPLPRNLHHHSRRRFRTHLTHTGHRHCMLRLCRTRRLHSTHLNRKSPNDSQCQHRTSHLRSTGTAHQSPIQCQQCTWHILHRRQRTWCTRVYHGRAVKMLVDCTSRSTMG